MPKISDLPSASSVGTTDTVPVVQSGTTKKATLAQIINALVANGVASSGANSNITSLTGLSTPLSIGQGGTGGNSAANARTNLSVPSKAEVQQQASIYVSTSGTGTAYTVTPSPAWSAYTAGSTLMVAFGAVSGANPTLQVSGLATPPNLIKENYDGSYSNIAAGDIPNGHVSRVTLITPTSALVEELPVMPLAAQQYAAFKNRIINGDMRIDQRGNGGGVTAVSGGAYPVDRWAIFKDTAAGTLIGSQSTTAPTGFKNSFLATVNTGYTVAVGESSVIRQAIEGLNWSDLGWGASGALPITVSFWARCNIAGTFGGAVCNGAFNRSCPFTYTINSANAWEYKTVTIAGDTAGTWATDNTMGARLLFAIGAGSNLTGTAGTWASSGLVTATGATNLTPTSGATLYLTGVQIEVGSAATPFERREYSTELLKCQRYYFKMLGAAATGYNSTGATVYGDARFACDMRVIPTITLSNFSPSNAANATAGATTTTQFVRLQTAITAGPAAGFCICTMEASAEL